MRKSITVKLPDSPMLSRFGNELRFKPGSSYTIQSEYLLTQGIDNPKMAKSKHQYRSYGLTLAPANVSGYNVCGKASDGCKFACLNTTGNGLIYQHVQAGRIAKTIALFEQRDTFEEMLWHEMHLADRIAKRKGYTIAFRPNVLSDLPFEKMFPWMFTEFPHWKFYDYTKWVDRVLGVLPRNYHLTFSRSEVNESDCLRVLEAHKNVSVVFKDKDIPREWNGYTVINGDKTDMRFLDPKGIVVGLYAKGNRAKGDKSGFVVRRTELPVLS